jgi:hypothetical protein
MHLWPVFQVFPDVGRAPSTDVVRTTLHAILSRFNNTKGTPFRGTGLYLASASGALAQWPQLLDTAEKVPTASAAAVSLPILSARGDFP